MYCFGHGLSYSRFEYANARASVAVSSDDTSANVGVGVGLSVGVTNVGARGGDEGVEGYLRGEVGSVTAPERALQAFGRVHVGPKEGKQGEVRRGAGGWALG